MHVLMLANGPYGVPPLYQGGIERGIHQLGRALVKQGTHVTLIDYDRSPSTGGILKRDGIQLWSVGQPWILPDSVAEKRARIVQLVFGWRALNVLKRRLEKEHAGLLHIHSAPSGLAIMSQKSKIGLPVVYSVHNGRWTDMKNFPLRERLTGTLLEQYCFRKADAVVTLNGSMELNIKPHVHNGGIVRSIPNGIDHSFWSPSNAKLLNSRTIVQVGYIQPLKNQLITVQACSQIRDLFDKLLFIGRPVGAAYQELVEVTARESGIGEKTFFLGELSSAEVHHYLSNATVFVHPSSFEASPVALLEAMSIGCAIIASDIAPHRAMLEAHDAGILINPVDVFHLAASLRNLLTAPSLRGRLSANARNAVLREYTWHTISSKYLDIYNYVESIETGSRQ